MPSPSSYPSIELPKEDLWSLLFERKDKPYPDDHVLIVESETGRNYTFTSAKETAIEFAKGLRSLWDWEKGDVLAIFSPNCIDFGPVMWGCHWAGGIVSPANPAYTADEFAFQLKDSGARAIVTQVAVVEVAFKAAAMVGIPQERIVVMGPKDTTFQYKHFSSIKNISGTSRYRRRKQSPEDTAFLPYSSGTTGRPKGVVLCHRNSTSNTLQIASIEGQTMKWDQDRQAAILPFYHIYGLTCLIHSSFYLGVPVHVMTRFDLVGFCKLVQEKKITYVYVAPPVLVQLGKNKIVDDYDLSSIRMITSGAAPLTRDLVETVYDRLKIPTRQAYGLTETSPCCHLQPWDRWQEHIGSVGTLVANMTAKYMDENGKEVPAGQVGELWVTGPNVFKGYLNNEAGTQNALVWEKDEPYAYFKTGDVGFADKDGNFYITDRVKELIKYKGYQVPPAELEGLLLGHENVSDVAVIGIDNKAEATEVPRAYVVLKGGVEADEATAKEIVQYVHGKVAQHKRLRGGVKFIAEIPKTASGKILRRTLKELAKKEEAEGAIKSKL